MVFSMSDFGTSLCTRSSGRRVYDVVSASMKPGETVVVFDFSGVATVTNSFADEVFGRLAFEHGMDFLRKNTKFANIDRFSAMVVRDAMENRNARRETVCC